MNYEFENILSKHKKIPIKHITRIPCTLLSEEPFALFTNELEEKSRGYSYLISKKYDTCQQAAKWEMNY